MEGLDGQSVAAMFWGVGAYGGLVILRRRDPPHGGQTLRSVFIVHRQGGSQSGVFRICGDRRVNQTGIQAL